jgi:hypothetical protein
MNIEQQTSVLKHLAVSRHPRIFVNIHLSQNYLALIAPHSTASPWPRLHRATLRTQL